VFAFSTLSAVSADPLRYIQSLFLKRLILNQKFSIHRIQLKTRGFFLKNAVINVRKNSREKNSENQSLVSREVSDR
jgi:hypothetical protein